MWFYGYCNWWEGYPTSPQLSYPVASEHADHNIDDRMMDAVKKWEEKFN